jgi:hypothetical protein
LQRMSNGSTATGREHVRADIEYRGLYRLVSAKLTKTQHWV